MDSPLHMFLSSAYFHFFFASRVCLFLYVSLRKSLCISCVAWTSSPDEGFYFIVTHVGYLFCTSPSSRRRNDRSLVGTFFSLFDSLLVWLLSFLCLQDFSYLMTIFSFFYCIFTSAFFLHLQGWKGFASGQLLFLFLSPSPFQVLCIRCLFFLLLPFTEYYIIILFTCVALSNGSFDKQSITK